MVLNFKTLAFLCLLIWAGKLECQNYGTGRIAFASKSEIPISSMVVHRSKVDKKNIKDFNSKFEEKQFYIGAIELYNEEDNLESQSFLNQSKEIINYVTLEYDSLGRIRNNYYKNGSVNCRNYKDNFEIRKSYNSEGILTEISVMERGSRGEILDRLFLSPSGDTTDRYTYLYDEKGNEIQFKRSGNEERLRYIIQKSYDNNNQLTEIKEFDSSGKLVQKQTIETIQNSGIEDKDYSVNYRKNYHQKYLKRKMKSYSTETIDFIDNYGNVVKRYTTEGCKNKTRWQVIYVKYEYQE